MIRLIHILKNDNDSLEHTNEVSIKPLVSFEVIEGFLRMGDLYMELNEEKNNKVFHEKAIHRYLLAATIYNQLIWVNTIMMSCINPTMP